MTGAAAAAPSREVSGRAYAGEGGRKAGEGEGAGGGLGTGNWVSRGGDMALVVRADRGSPRAALRKRSRREVLRPLVQRMGEDFERIFVGGTEIFDWTEDLRVLGRGLESRGRWVEKRLK